jgi:hypothetical protein
MNSTFRAAGLGLLALTALAVFPIHETRSDDAKAASRPNPIEGAWRQVEQKNGEAQEYQKVPGGTEFIDCITGGRFVWTVVTDGKLLASAGGRYKSDKEKFSETIEFVHGAGVPESFVGSTFDFTVTIEGDTMRKVGTIQVNGQDFKIDEKWERCR